MRMEGKGNLFSYEESGITSDEEGLGEFGSVGVEVIRVAADSLPLDDEREGDEIW